MTEAVLEALGEKPVILSDSEGSPEEEPVILSEAKNGGLPPPGADAGRPPFPQPGRGGQEKKDGNPFSPSRPRAGALFLLKKRAGYGSIRRQE